jgi:O-antigen/teichoic acid export membrane protein
MTFAKSALFAYASQIFMLLNGLLYTYLIANSLGPEEYGIFIYILSFITILVSIFGLDIASEVMNIFTSRYRSKKLFFGIMKIQNAVTIPLFIALLFFTPFFAGFLLKGSAGILRIAALIVMLYPVSLLFNSCLKGHKMFGKVLKVAVIENAANLALAFAFVIALNMGIEGAIYAKIISFAVGIGISAFYITGTRFEERHFERKEAISYGKIGFVRNFVVKGTKMIQLFFIGAFIDPISMGFYYFMEKIFSYVTKIPVVSIDEVFIPFFGDKADNPEVLSNYVSLNFKAVFCLSIIFALLLFILAPVMTLYIFPKFTGSLYMVPYFALNVALSGMLIPFGNAYRILNKNKYLLLLSVVSTLNMVVAGYFLISNFGTVGLILTGISGTMLTAPAHWFFLRHLGLKIKVLPTKEDFRLLKQLFRKIKVFLKGQSS